MKEPKQITYSELMAEVDKIRGKSEPHRSLLTQEQRKFIDKCRSKNPPLSFDQILTLWNKMDGWWNYVCSESLRKMYKRSLTQDGIPPK